MFRVTVPVQVLDGAGDIVNQIASLYQGWGWVRVRVRLRLGLRLGSGLG
jgi:hypothetical protein